MNFNQPRGCPHFDHLRHQIESLDATEKLHQQIRQLNGELGDAKEKLSRKERDVAYYQSVLNHLPELVCRFLADGTLTFVNQAYCTYFGRLPEELIGRSFLELIPEADRSVPLQQIATLLQTKGSSSSEHQVITADGSLCWQEWTDYALCDANGNVVEFQAIGREISDRKQAEAQLCQSEAKLQEAQRVAHVGSWELDLKTQEITLSEEAFHIFGFAPRQPEPSCQEHLQRIHPDDRELIQTLVKQIAETGQPYKVDFRILNPDGSVRHIEGRGEASLNPQGQITQLFGTLLDITDRKLLEEQLRWQAERERILRQITTHIRQSLNIDTILKTTVSEVQRSLQADRVLIYRFQPDWSGVVLVESVAEPWIAVQGTKLRDPCFAERYIEPYRQGRLHVVADVHHANLNPCYVELLTTFGVKANLVVPILQENRNSQRTESTHSTPILWGLLIVHQCSGRRQWQDAEVDLLRQLAVQVGIAVEQAEFHRQVQRFNAELERQVQARTIELQLAYEFESTLKRITDKVRDSLDESQILQSAVEELAKGLGISCCNAALFDLEQGTSTICYEYTTFISPFQRRVSRMADFPEIYQQLLQGEYFQFCSLIPNPVRGEAAMFCCPILDNQGVLGDLWLINHSYSVFSEQDIRLVQQVANQCAIALRQSRLYQTAQAQVQELERLNQLKDDFLSTVSHELRTPMTNIKMATQMLEIGLKQSGELGAKPNSINRYFQILKDECQREISLISDLLNLTRLETGGEPLSPIAVDFPRWLTELIKPFAERAHSQQQQLEIDIPRGFPTLTTDVSYLERILLELLNNACKYTPAGGVITVAARSVGKKDEGLRIKDKTGANSSFILDYLSFQISVTNTGIEIPAQERDRIFDKFYRIPNNDPWKHGGTGLGLALVKRLIEQLGGKIQVVGAQGQTTFIVELPPGVEQPSVLQNRSDRDLTD
ncbi:PAS domain S-box protein [Kovacikia minuta CCNUW1]|uniref:sensor histidine kinase n=1 Tax=Kovacikia minuta TaxID=2931930 RepID=UPI001CCEFE0B|nr:GAF domain-containing sensor histidine kinase [Kovacikia minuta]UBF23610.1 PAS domain S-box protein [Kovacikia minuta CCNUW1]